ncbi:hypothetical protein M9H77_08938 [Catharanthus roseus]|uniref:Uncharacterized protein n=1 Tax=Catharanthus roseus TaxID=4058 RepID=A0ACC0BZJ2_CATRO|nr:hypothetical protein M9H77_08938 [Catharanthus roseus]
MYFLPEKLEVSNSPKFVTPFFKPYEIPTQFIKELGIKRARGKYYSSMSCDFMHDVICFDVMQKILLSSIGVVFPWFPQSHPWNLILLVFDIATHFYCQNCVYWVSVGDVYWRFCLKPFSNGKNTSILDISILPPFTVSLKNKNKELFGYHFGDDLILEFRFKLLPFDDSRDFVVTELLIRGVGFWSNWFRLKRERAFCNAECIKFSAYR